jgi:hypothetical protein
MQQKRKEVIQSVLQEQYWQRCHGIYDSDRIKVVCKNASEWARSRALKIGSDDARKAGHAPSPSFLSVFHSDECSLSMELDDSSTSLPSDCGLSSDNTSSTSEVSDDPSWTEKQMNGDLTPES